MSILRNWTVGELGTISASVGILAHYLAVNPALQRQLRERPYLLPVAIDEILRIHAPLIMNRRVAVKPVSMRARELAVGERIAIIWASANRDEAVFGDPDEFRLDRDPGLNLLYGAGIHVCPGAPLARLELRIVMEELLKRTHRITPIADKATVNAHFPASGFSSLPLWIQKSPA
ncbi:MAG: cytochrome P450 [Burkholderiaceae bacterium]